MAKLYIPGQSPIAKAARGWPSTPNKAPKVAWQPNFKAEQLALLTGVSSYAQKGKFVANPAATIEINKNGNLGVDNSLTDYSAVSDTSLSYTGWGGFTLVFEYQHKSYSQPTGYNTLVALDSESHLSAFFIQLDGSPVRGDCYVGPSNAGSVPPEWISRLIDGEPHKVGISYDENQISFFNDGIEFTPIASTYVFSGSGKPQLGSVNNLSNRTCRGIWSSFMLAPGGSSAAIMRELTRRFYQTAFKPANQSPFIIGTAGAPPLEFDETAQVAATATVTAAETYTPPVAPSYDETAQMAAMATITALETYTPPAGTDNNVWVGADRLDALAVGATVLDQAYVGTVPVLNQ